jgi:hypothetical protein
MHRKFLLSASLAGLLLSGMAVHGRPTQQESQPKQQSQQAKSVNGKVTNIAGDKKSFTVEVNEGSAKRSMEFVIDGNTQVQGRVGVGTDATVEFQPSSDGKLVALTITPRTGQSPSPGN